MKVMLSPGKILMPKVSGQERKFGIQILTILIPASYGTNSELVTCVVDPRPLASATVRNSTLPEQSTKQLVNGGYAEGPSTRSREEDCIRWALFKMGRVL